MTPRHAALALLAVLAFAGAVGVRAAASGRDDLATARGARDAGLEGTARDFYARAARWYLPVAGVHRAAREELRDLAVRAEADGRPDDALAAWRELRGAILGTRWLLTPDRDLLDAANHAIARLMAAQDARLRGDRALDEAGHLALLRRDASPDPWASLAASWLFLAWVVVTGLGAWRSVTADGAIRGRAALGWGAGSLGLLALWLIALAVS